MNLTKTDDIVKLMEAGKGSFKSSADRMISINEAKASNTAKIQKNLWENKEIRWMRESFQKKWGFDFADSTKFPVMSESFDWNKVAQKCGAPSVKAALREADSASNFVQVLRAGIQNIVNSMYMTVPTTYEAWTSTVNSKRDTELYAPLQGITFLQQVGPQEVYPESAAAGLDIKLKNYKYGTIYAVEMELLEDDQTGQFAQQTALLGEYARLAMEVICMAKLAGQFTGGVYANYAGLRIPHSETQPSNETNYPWTNVTAPFVGGGYNKPVSFGALTQPNIQNGFIGLMNQLNMLGLKMQVDPNTIIVGPKWRFDLAVLLNSSFYPSQVASADGTTGSFMAINPIQSIAKAVISRFMFNNLGTVNQNSSAWYIVDSNKPFFVSQLRQATEVVQEAPNSGESFDRDVIRFKVNMRGNADFIDPRFAWQGNDGSV